LTQTKTQGKSIRRKSTCEHNVTHCCSQHVSLASRRKPREFARQCNFCSKLFTAWASVTQTHGGLQIMKATAAEGCAVYRCHKIPRY